eukprot:scaffold37391_cov41-Cyclotella_meneghiniana.AAC.1
MPREYLERLRYFNLSLLKKYHAENSRTFAVPSRYAAHGTFRVNLRQHFKCSLSAAIHQGCQTNTDILLT